METTAYSKSGAKIEHLPCAGITLFRFYGYYLSLSRHWRNQHPEESENLCKGKIKMILGVTFFGRPSSD